MIIYNVNIVNNDGVQKDSWIEIREGYIHDIGSGLPCNIKSDSVNGNNHFILPGAIEMHIHGANGVDAMDGSSDFYDNITAYLPSTGSTSFLATTMTNNIENIENALINLSKYNYTGGAEMIGIHLEGPFLSKKHCGAQNPNLIIDPDSNLISKFQKLSKNKIKLITYAPENDKNFSFLKHLQSLNIIPSVGHSDATYELLLDTEKQGLSHVTHLYNGMRGLHHREPGVVGFAFMSNSNVEIIPDGIHSKPAMVKLAYENITSDRLIIITDAMRAQGLQDGNYDLGGQNVILKNKEARLSSGSLAGSVLTMKEAVKNMKNYTNCSWPDIVKMTSYNQAKELGLLNRKGIIKKGNEADLVVYDAEANLISTYVKGVQHY